MEKCININVDSLYNVGDTFWRVSNITEKFIIIGIELRYIIGKRNMYDKCEINSERLIEIYYRAMSNNKTIVCFNSDEIKRDCIFSTRDDVIKNILEYYDSKDVQSSDNQ